MVGFHEIQLHEIRVNQQKFQGLNDPSIFYSIGIHVSLAPQNFSETNLYISVPLNTHW